MKLVLIYHVYKNTTHLEASLASIFNQTNKKFKLILVNDGASKQVNNILKKFEFDKLNDFTYHSFNQNLGHSASFNVSLASTDGDYVYYTGSNAILNKDFVKIIHQAVKTHPKTDIISFAGNQKNDGKISAFKNITPELQAIMTHSMKKKVFSITLLKNNNIRLNEDKYFPLVFIYEAMAKARKWVFIDKQLVSFESNRTYTYNLYDIFEMNDYLINKYQKTMFWKQNKDLIELWMIMFVIQVFIPRIFVSYKSNIARKAALIKAKS
ncbi:putative glycosyl transferase [Bacteroidales bacterium Barb6]|nr:putative glycosyl transferase [Bacteroidales bacterium Barb6]